jgi:hypothetical protein
MTTRLSARSFDKLARLNRLLPLVFRENLVEPDAELIEPHILETKSYKVSAKHHNDIISV